MKRNTAELKKKLIHTGVMEIKKNGIEQLSLRTVAKSCDVTHGTPYRHFESKEGYLRAVLSEISSIFGQKITEDITEEMLAREKLVSMGHRFVMFAKQKPHFFEAMILKYPFKFMTVENSNIEIDCEPPGFQSFHQVIEDLFVEESLNTDVTTAIFHLWSYITGFAVLANSPNGHLLDSSAVKKQIDTMLEFYIKGAQS